jgi:hypothetical protein
MAFLQIQNLIVLLAVISMELKKRFRDRIEVRFPNYGSDISLNARA